MVAWATNINIDSDMALGSSPDLVTTIISGGNVGYSSVYGGIAYGHEHELRPRHKPRTSACSLGHHPRPSPQQGHRHPHMALASITGHRSASERSNLESELFILGNPASKLLVWGLGLHLFTLQAHQFHLSPQHMCHPTPLSPILSSL